MEEKRTLPRWKIRSSCAYEVVGKETTKSGAFLEDINLVGAKVYLGTPESRQSKVRLEIKIPDQLVPIFVEGEVVWQNSPKSIGFPTGVRFTAFKPADKKRVLDYFQDEIKQNWWREEQDKNIMN